MTIQFSPFQHCCAAESAYGLRAPDCACVFFSALLGTEWPYSDWQAVGLKLELKQMK